MEYPTLFTAGTRWLAPRDVNDARRGRPSTRPGTSSGTGSSRRTSSSTRGWTKGSTPIRPRASSSRRSAAPTTRSATSAASSRGCFATCRCGRDDRRRSAAGVPPAATGDPQSTPNWRVLARNRGRDHLRQDRVVAAHARAHGGLADHAAHHVDLLLAMGIPASEARGLLRRRQRSQRTRSDLVLRSGLSQVRRVRLWRRHASERAERRARLFRRGRAADGSSRRRGTRANTHHGRRAATTATASSRSTCGVVFENKEEIRWHWDGRDRWKTVRDREARPRASFAAGRSRAHAAARRELHEQLGDARAARAAGAARKWSLTWLVWLQDHLLTYGFFV